jgi:hypothetical protein
MNTDPMLAARPLPAGTDGHRVPLFFRVEGGLHYIRGNAAPYFSLTYTQHRRGNRNQCQSGGAGHERILELFPRFADLAALHLADIDGVPMHAEANGWYYLAGALGGAGERYHGGQPTGYGPPPDPLATFARHCRVTLDEAAAIRDDVRAAYAPPPPHLHRQYPAPDAGDWRPARARWGEILDAMRPRWKREAEACIARHHLRVYGDPWPPVAVTAPEVTKPRLPGEAMPRTAWDGIA